MDSHVQLDAYSLLIITNKAKDKFKTYCINVKQYPLSKLLCPSKEVTKTMMGVKYKVVERLPLPYNEQIAHVVSRTQGYVCPMYDVIVKYNEAAVRSRLTNLDVTFNLPFKQYKEIIDIAEYGNY